MECNVPFAEFDCPHYNRDTGLCELGNPIAECDDYWFYNSEEEEEEEW